MEQILKNHSLQTLQRGSLLVGVLVFSIVLAIGGGAVLLLATHSLGQVTDGFEEDRKFHAADGGMKLAFAWIRAGGLPIANTTLFFPSINGYPDSVLIKLGSAGRALVRSKVKVVATAEKPLQWYKIARCQIRVSNAPVANSIALSECIDSTLALIFHP